MAGKEKKAGPISFDEMADIYTELSKEHGQERIFWGSDQELEVVKIPLGVEPIDKALGGGFALGRMTELIGEWSSGKSLLSFLVIKAAQELGYACAYIDSERTFDPAWAEVLGVDTGKLLLPRPLTGESAFDMLSTLCKRRVGVVVLDSLASMAPSARLAEKEGQSLPAIQARMINQGLMDVNAVNDVTCIVLINQLRESIGVSFGSPETLPGGKGQRFFASLMVRVRRGPWIEEDFPGRGKGEKKKRVGFNLKVIVEKNKAGGSQQYDHGEVPFFFSGVIDVVAGLVPMAIDMGIIKQEGANYTLFDQKVYGRRNLIELVAKEPDIQERIREEMGRVPEF